MANATSRTSNVSDTHVHDSAQFQHGDRNDFGNTYNAPLDRSRSYGHYNGIIHGNVSQDVHNGPEQHTKIAHDAFYGSTVNNSSVNNFYGAYGSSVDLSGSKGAIDEFIDASNAFAPTDSSRNRFFDVPFGPDENFTGRDKELVELKALLPSPGPVSQSRKRLVLHGLGGSGKSQICLKFVQERRPEFWGIFWIDASSCQNVERGLMGLSAFKKDVNIGFDLDENDAEAAMEAEDHQQAPASEASDDANSKRNFSNKMNILGIAKRREATRKHNLDRILKTLSAVKEPWLLIFDNADDPDMKLDPYIPNGEHGSVLVTTRNEHFEIKGGSKTIRVDSLEANEAIEVYRKARNIESREFELKGPKHRTAVQTLVIDCLGGLPLAINQASTYMRKQNLAPAQYQKTFEDKRASLLSDIKTMANNTYHAPVWATWEVSVEAISEKATDESRDALELLYLFSCLSNRHIPQRLFRRAWKRINSGMAAEQWIGRMTGGKEWFKKHQPDILSVGGDENSWDLVEERFNNALELLTSYSLVTIKNSEDVNRKRERDSTERWIYLHPLVHAWAYDRLESQYRDKSLTVAAFMAFLAASGPFRSPMDQFELLFRDLAHHLERLATRFIHLKNKYAVAFDKHQLLIVKGLMMSLYCTFQFSLAQRLRRELLGSARRFLVERAKSGTTVTADFLRRRGSPSLGARSPDLISDGFSESSPDPESSPDLRRDTSPSRRRRAGRAVMKKFSPMIRQRSGGNLQTNFGDGQTSQEGTPSIIVESPKSALEEDPLAKEGAKLLEDSAGAQQSGSMDSQSSSTATKHDLATVKEDAEEDPSEKPMSAFADVVETAMAEEALADQAMVSGEKPNTTDGQGLGISEGTVDSPIPNASAELREDAEAIKHHVIPEKIPEQGFDPATQASAKATTTTDLPGSRMRLKSSKLLSRMKRGKSGDAWANV